MNDESNVGLSSQYKRPKVNFFLILCSVLFLIFFNFINSTYFLSIIVLLPTFVVFVLSIVNFDSVVNINERKVTKILNFVISFFIVILGTIFFENKYHSTGFAFLFLYVVFLVASLIFSVYDIVLLKQFGARIFTWLNIFLSIIVLFIFYTAFMSAVSNSLFYNLSDKAERSGNLNDCRAPAFIVFISDYDENRCTLYIKK